MNTRPPAHGFPRRPVRLAALAAAVVLMATGCSVFDTADDPSDAKSAGAAGDGMSVVMVTHGGEGDIFWDRVKKGAEAAAAKDGINLTYVSDADPEGQAELVRNAVRDKVDGIALTLAKPQAMKGPVEEARKAGIPVVGLNSGIDAWKSSGLLEYFGQDDGVAGQAVGNKLNELKAKNALCVIHERGNVGLEARCAGMRKTFDGKFENLYVDGSDERAVSGIVTATLRQDPTIDEVVANGAQYGLLVAEAAKKADTGARVASFDLTEELVDAVRGGDIQFAVDQQPYLQGYLSVDALWLYRTNGNISGGGVSPVLTGPAFVTKNNAASVAEFAANGTR
ncbi:substrate-binding domain-containing protein [Streptomyces sp. NBC_01635]|uniref:substrate-binding domain-containing protein n=1 Tax=Streptomyces sp. NBC_01635 TaxID=2975904 RepID=UPI00386EC02E|nr:substrate-binding domain-containing protein [Streptomyces sp. NBC_01635]